MSTSCTMVLGTGGRSSPAQPAPSPSVTSPAGRRRRSPLWSTTSSTARLSREGGGGRLAIAGTRAEGLVIQALSAADPRGQVALLGVLERLASASAGRQRALLGRGSDRRPRRLPQLRRVSAPRIPTACAHSTRWSRRPRSGPRRGGAAGDHRRPRRCRRRRTRRCATTARGSGTAIRRALDAAAGSRRDRLRADRDRSPPTRGTIPWRCSGLLGEGFGSQGGLAALHQLVLALGHRERTAATDAERAGWTLASGRRPRAGRPRQPVGPARLPRCARAHAARAPRRAGGRGDRRRGLPGSPRRGLDRRRGNDAGSRQPAFTAIVARGSSDPPPRGREGRPGAVAATPPTGAPASQILGDLPGVSPG